jgi:Phage integrase, N-terminal SAM-like domain
MIMPVIMCSCDPGGERSTTKDIQAIDDASGPLVTDDALRPLIAAWLLSFKSPHTVRSYRNDLAHWLAFCADHNMDPLEARRAHIDAWGRVLEAQGLKERSVGRRLSAVSSWYQYLVHDGVLTASPTQHVRRPKISDEGTTPGLTRDELRRLLAARTYGSPRSVALVAAGAYRPARRRGVVPRRRAPRPRPRASHPCAWSAKAAAPCSPHPWSAHWMTTLPAAGGLHHRRPRSRRPSGRRPRCRRPRRSPHHPTLRPRPPLARPPRLLRRDGLVEGPEYKVCKTVHAACQ